MTSKKTEQKYPQLQSIRLNEHFSWIADAIAWERHGKRSSNATMVRELLDEALGVAGNANLRIMDYTAGDADLQLPPTRLVKAYAHLSKAIVVTGKAATKRLGWHVDNADVIRSAMWAALVARGVKAPAEPPAVTAAVLANERLSDAELAAALGVGVHIVSKRRKRLGLVSPKASSNKRLTAAERSVALSPRLTQVEAAAKLGVSQKTISLIRSKAGYVAPKGRPATGNRYDVGKMYEAVLEWGDSSVGEVVKKYGLAPATVTRWRERLGEASKVLLDHHLSVHQAAETTGVPIGVVRRVRQKAGVAAAFKPRRKSAPPRK